MSILVATPGAANANSYLTVAEFNTYLATRINSDSVVELDVPVKEQLLITATRTLDGMLNGVRIYVPELRFVPPHYETSPSWTGLPASATQALAWCRTGMFNRNGFPIDPAVIPQELKDATAELAFQLYTTDSTLDNSVAVQGITSIKAGSVAITFGSDILTSKVLPDAVKFLLVRSWLTDVVYDYLNIAEFEVF